MREEHHYIIKMIERKEQNARDSDVSPKGRWRAEITRGLLP